MHRKVKPSDKEHLNWLPKLSYFKNDFFLAAAGFLILEKYSMGTSHSPCNLFSYGLTFFSFMQNKPTPCFLILRAGMPPPKKSQQKPPNARRKNNIIMSSLELARLAPFPKFFECIILILRNLLACFDTCPRLCCSSASLLPWP